MRPFHRWTLWLSTGFTGVTGVVYFWMDRVMAPVEPWAAINHPLQPWVLKAHILAAPALVLAIGLIATDHIWRHFRGNLSKARKSGVTVLWVLAPMVLSGYLIQAVTRPAILAVVAWIHIGTGVVYLAGVSAHRSAAKRRPSVLPRPRRSGQRTPVR